MLTAVPDAALADSIARRLVDERIAACVSVGAPVRSLYHRRGKTETAGEFPLMIKTTTGCYKAIEALVRSLHPYEVPEIIAIPITAGFAPYLDWIATETERSMAASIVA